MYTVDYFIAKFQAIPENKFISYDQGRNQPEHCALGWCKNILGQYGCATTVREYPLSFSPEAVALNSLLIESDIRIEGCVYPANVKSGYIIAQINNGGHPQFQQPTEKQRILAALQYVKAQLEQVEISDPPVMIEDILGEAVEAQEMALTI